MLTVPAATTTTFASTRWSAPAPSTYSTPRASPSSITTRSTRASARSSRRPAAQASWMYVLSVDLPAFVGQPCRHEPQLMQFASVYERTGWSSAPRARKPGSTVWTLLRQSVRSRTPRRASTRS